MSGLDVIGGISAVIGIVDASIKIYQSAQKDAKLPDTFHVVGRRLPIIRDTLDTCKSHLQPIQDSLPADVCEALEKTLDGCDDKAGKLRTIFEKVLPKGNDGWKERYRKIVERLGQGTKVEELMMSITEDVQLVVNHHAVNSVKPEQMAELKKIVQEMKSVQPSMPEEAGLGMTINSQGGAQTNNINSGSGQQINNHAAVKNQYFGSVVVQPKADLSFQNPVGLCLGQAPHIDAKLFIGREFEITQMREILRPDESTLEQRRLVLSGTGGMGKTQLAIAFAKRHRQEYDSVFWLNAASEATLKDSFRIAAEAIFNVQDAEGLPDEQILIQIRRWLSDKQNTRWLLIFDNHDDPSQYHIERYYPYVSHGAIIVTTRRPDLVAGSELRLQPLQRVEEGLEILETRSQRKNVESNSHARRLAERLAGLPLALATAGAYLHYSTFTFERYFNEYEERWNIDPRRLLSLQEYQDRTLYTTWDLSYSRLQGEDANAARLLGLLAYFSNQRLWYELFQGGLSDGSPPWLHELISTDVKFEGTMILLTKYCFLEVQTSASWSMHTCVHDWTLATLNEVVDEKQYWYAFDCVWASIEQEDLTSLGHFRLTDVTAHVLRLGHVSDHRGGVMKSLSDNRLSRAYIIAELLTQQVQLKAAEHMYQRTLKGCENALGKDHTSTLNTVNNLGLLYADQGKLEEAEKMYQRALQGCEKALGKDHMSTLMTVGNLGNLYRNQGKLDQAEKMYQRALQGKEKALGKDHTSTLSTVNNLGLLYADQGKLEEAEIMYQRALQGCEKALGKDHTSTLMTVGNLGNLYRNQGKLDQAEKMYQRALQGCEKALGKDHTSTLSTVSNLGNLYRSQGKLKEAEIMYQRALQGFENALGKDHTSTLNTVNNLGLLYADQGKLEEAETMYQRALQGCEKALGKDHTSTLSTVNNLGNLYRDQGKLDQAEKIYQRTLQGYEKALGKDHTSTLNTVNNLGLLYADQGKLEEAEKIYQRALQGKEKALGKDHTSTLNTVNNLGLLYADQGKLDQAEMMYQRALQGYEKTLGVDLVNTYTPALNTCQNLARLLLLRDRPREAMELCQRALAGFRKVLGSSHQRCGQLEHAIALIQLPQESDTAGAAIGHTKAKSTFKVRQYFRRFRE